MIRRLHETGYDRREVVNLFKFIDWVMILPEGLKQAFWMDLKAYEEERKVPYITSVEEIGFERGMQQGRQEEARSLILRQLTRRLGELPEPISGQLEALSVAQLEILGEALLDFSHLSNLEAWLEGQKQ
ncbi:DUF4351 domain-containing protein [Leptolyngbya sp. 'hensonii']|uniref:DUF4351 domain-containing protein n=1 Tax=Leptolyngbya sp. 'hensonii' TaxID=1922337 RepID=UPI000AB4F848|nr:DUF4351 domain-containing protein [Leptolyngbya sp. 'hensonii']